MPCNTIVYVTIDAARFQASTLTEALEEMGFQVRELEQGALSFQRGGYYGTFRAGQISAPAGMLDATTLNREYARAQVKRTAKARGWKVKETSRYELEVTKR